MFRSESLNINLKMKQYLKEKSNKNMLGGSINCINERTFWLINNCSVIRNNFQMPNEGNVPNNKIENDHTSYQPKGNVNVRVHWLLWQCCKLFILTCSKKPGTEEFYAQTLQWNGKRRTVALRLIQCSFYYSSSLFSVWRTEIFHWLSFNARRQMANLEV